MEIQKIKEWMEYKGKQFRLTINVGPNNNMFSSAVNFSQQAIRFKDREVFSPGDLVVFINGKGIAQSAGLVDFCVDCIHVSVTFNSITMSIEINELKTIPQFIREISNKFKMD